MARKAACLLKLSNGTLKPRPHKPKHPGNENITSGGHFLGSLPIEDESKPSILSYKMEGKVGDKGDAKEYSCVQMP